MSQRFSTGLVLGSLLLLGVKAWFEPQKMYVRTQRDGRDLILHCDVQNRWPPGQKMAGSSISWHRATGFVAEEFGVSGNTTWSEDGTLVAQFDYQGGERTSPPWQWGRSDRPEPSAPWALEGLSFVAWWEELPYDQKAESMSEALGNR